jgi:hypothetical protein
MYSYFSQSLRRYLNVDTMLRQLAGNSYPCFRCNRKGAAVSCTTCGKMFHGFSCSKQYLLPQAQDIDLKNDTGLLNPQYWQCLFCQNYHNHQAVPDIITNRQPYLLSLRKLPRNHLLAEVTQSYVESRLKRQVTYMPQVNDRVCYFWQGHEAYTYQYNCHHYAG